MSTCYKFISTFILFLSCSLLLQGQLPSELFRGQEMDTTKVLETIAFGSCNNQEKTPDLWPSICKNKPNLWIWLGDNIYADTKDMKLMKRKYMRAKFNPRYKLIRNQCPQIGIWDDHDFGTNDGCKTYPMKKESSKLMLDFLDVPKNADVRKRDGIYQSYTMGSGDRKIKFILLDTRYFRDQFQKSSGKKGYVPCDGDMLGEAQWAWLEKELTNSDAQIHVIASGVQVIPKEHVFEKWANLPKSRERLFNLLQKTKPNNAILLSGDRHIAEISKIDLAGLDYPLYEITSSGMTHTWKEIKNEPNKYRASDLIIKRNFALLQVNWDMQPIELCAEIRGMNNELFYRYELVMKK